MNRALGLSTFGYQIVTVSWLPSFSEYKYKNIETTAAPSLVHIKYLLTRKDPIEFMPGSNPLCMDEIYLSQT